MSNDPALSALIKDCGLIENRAGGDYYHQHGKVCISQPGALKIQAKKEISLGVPSIAEVAGRIIVSGEATMGEQSYWTTGEADPSGKAVEKTHPLAMAEKRWRVRAILGLALDPTLTATVYGADEFAPDWHSQGTQPQPQASSQPPTNPDGTIDHNANAPAELPEWAQRLPQDWNLLMAKVGENTDCDRATFESAIFDHITRNEYQGKVYFASSFHKTFGAWAYGKSKNGKPLFKVAFHAMKNQAAPLAERLASGESVRLNINTDQGEANFTLSPKGQGDELPAETAPAGAFDDDCPF